MTQLGSTIFLPRRIPFDYLEIIIVAMIQALQLFFDLKLKRLRLLFLQLKRSLISWNASCLDVCHNYVQRHFLEWRTRVVHLLHLVDNQSSVDVAQWRGHHSVEKRSQSTFHWVYDGLSMRVAVFEDRQNVAHLRELGQLNYSIAVLIVWLILSESNIVSIAINQLARRVIVVGEWDCEIRFEGFWAIVVTCFHSVWICIGSEVLPQVISIVH